MYLNTLENSEKMNVKLTVLDDFLEEKSSACEIVVNFDYLNFLFLNLIIMKNFLYKNADNTYLTKREGEILKYIAEGRNNTDIADYLNITIHTVKLHISNIFQKLKVKDRTQAVVKAVKTGLLDIYSV